QNPVTGDCRVAGMLASLTGVERAVAHNDNTELELALARIYLLNSVILSIGGLPLLYMGDELGLLNDYSYQKDPTKRDDSRWVNRVKMSEQQLQDATDKKTLSGKVYAQLQQLIAVRSQLAVLGNGSTVILQSNNPHLFAYQREIAQQQLLCIVNFSESAQLYSHQHSGVWQDEFTGNRHQGATISLQPYQVLWLTPQA
ncbi:MAG: alpha-glucosidase C-terminal domain-containing protein, partial [Paraglaciecola sp.]|nr:alpha-glucosidase C-terminal domain-containing protein [Paraglaciecola sp.]